MIFTNLLKNTLILIISFSISNTAFTPSKIKIGTSNAKITSTDQTSLISIYKINTNYQKINISINSISNINLIQITDSKDDININECNNKSNLCQSISL